MEAIDLHNLPTDALLNELGARQFLKGISEDYLRSELVRRAIVGENTLEDLDKLKLEGIAVALGIMAKVADKVGYLVCKNDVASIRAALRPILAKDKDECHDWICELLYGAMYDGKSHIDDPEASTTTDALGRTWATIPICSAKDKPSNEDLEKAQLLRLMWNRISLEDLKAAVK